MNTKTKPRDNTLIISLLVAALTIAGHIYVTVLQTKSTERQAYARIQADLILEARRDPKLADENMRQLLYLGMIEDPDGHLTQMLFGPTAGNPPDKTPPYFWLLSHNY